MKTRLPFESIDEITWALTGAAHNSIAVNKIVAAIVFRSTITPRGKQTIHLDLPPPGRGRVSPLGHASGAGGIIASAQSGKALAREYYLGPMCPFRQPLLNRAFHPPFRPAFEPESVRFYRRGDGR